MPAIPPIFDDESPSLARSSSSTSSHLLSLFGSHRFLPDGGSLFSSSNPSSRLVRRQQFRQDTSGSTSGYIPLVYDDLNSGPSPGAVVGIVLGSVIGFLLVVWLFYAIAAMGGGSRAYAADEEVVVRERRPRSTRSRRSRRSSRPEIREISRSPRRQRIVVEERRSSVPPAPRPRSRSVVVEERVTERERRVDGDDIVEVIEETSPPGRRVSSRRNSGYRSVDPDRFAGGNYPQRPVPNGKGRTTTTRRTIVD